MTVCFYKFKQNVCISKNNNVFKSTKVSIQTTGMTFFKLALTLTLSFPASHSYVFKQVLKLTSQKSKVTNEQTRLPSQASEVNFRFFQIILHSFKIFSRNFIFIK